MDIFTSAKTKTIGVDSPNNLDELLAATDSNLTAPDVAASTKTKRGRPHVEAVQRGSQMSMKYLLN